MKTKASISIFSETSTQLLSETFDYMGQVLSAYGRLKEAELNQNEDAYDSALADLSTALFMLRDKAEQSHDRIDEDIEALPD